MSTFCDRWALPLFAKELADRSGKRQTYLIRAGYAVFLSLAALFFWSHYVPKVWTSSAALLAVGPSVGNWIYYLQSIGIQWLWPVIACSAFAGEKERNTLQLLLLTRLTPRTIVLEKFCSLLLVVLSFILISIPILVCCFSMGGLSFQTLLIFLMFLIVQAVEMTAISLFCSAWFSTTASALVGTYFVAGISKLLFCALVASMVRNMKPSFYNLLIGTLNLDPPYHVGEWTLPLLYKYSAFMIDVSAISLGFSAIYLVLAWMFLVRQTFSTAQETTIKSFVDEVGKLANRFNQNSLTRGAVLIREGRREPEYDPVAWRETTTRALGQPRYLIGNFLALELPIISFLIMVIAKAQGMEVFTAIGTMQSNLWIGMLLMIAMVVSGMINLERQKNTWETLLVTPITNREIVQQKMDGIQRMLWILQAPLWTCMVFRACFEGSVAYVLNDVSMLLIYPRIVAWLAMTCGVIYKKRMQAMLMTVATALAWLAIGGGIAMILSVNPFANWLRDVSSPEEVAIGQLLIAQFCPATLAVVNIMAPEPSATNTLMNGFDEVISMRHSLLPSVWNLLIYSTSLYLIRRRCLKIADRTLRGE
jgi:ABC-type transport system involved in multi-copper enzyme maturation permease subunit